MIFFTTKIEMWFNDFIKKKKKLFAANPINKIFEIIYISTLIIYKLLTKKRKNFNGPKFKLMFSLVLFENYFH